MADSLKVIIDCSLKDLSNRVESLVEEFQVMKGKDIGSFYGTPIDSFRAQRRYKPQIILEFQEDWQKYKTRVEAEPTKTLGRGRISFRMMEWKDDETITPGQVEAIATRIKSLFGGSQQYIWRKGQILCSYCDWEEGYQLQILCLNQSEGQRVIEQVLDVRQKSPDWKNCFKNENIAAAARYKSSPGKKLILGKRVNEVEERPIVEVQFSWAELHLHSLPNPLILYDATGKKNDPIIT